MLTPERIERDSRYWRQKTVAQAAWEKADNKPEEIAIYLEDEPPITFGSIADEALRLIKGLQNLGMVEGDVISFQLPNWREAVVLDIAASAMGLIVNPIIPIYRDHELSFILQDARTKLIYIPETIRSLEFPSMLIKLQNQLPLLEHIVTVRAERDYDGVLKYERLVQNKPANRKKLPTIDPNSVKCILYTSGTTGSPKAVLHSHNTLSRVIDNSVECWGLDENDIMMMPSPVTHITGYGSGMVLPFITDVKSALMARWDANAAVAFIDRIGATCSVGATPFLKELLMAAENNQTRLPSLRYFACGGAAVPPQLIQQVYRELERCKAFRVYGSTETPIITQGFVGDDQEDLAAETDGMIYQWDIKIVDDNGVEVPNGVDGEIAARGAGMMLGYGDETQQASAHDDEGYFLTGDIGHRTADNAILITDRKKDIIIRGGENLSAKEIEDVLHGHEDIQEAAVVSMPHDRLGEGVAAYIIAKGKKPNLSSITLLADRVGLAKQKIPEYIDIVDDLPRTPSGKVRKDVLRKQLRTKLMEFA